MRRQPNRAWCAVRAAIVSLAVVVTGVCILSTAADGQVANMKPRWWAVNPGGTISGQFDVTVTNPTTQPMTFSIAVGIRNTQNGNWVGGEPQVCLTDTMVAGDVRTYTNVVWSGVVAPTTAGFYRPWVRAEIAPSNVITAFKNNHPLADTGQDNTLGVVVVSQAGVIVDPQSIRGMPWRAGTDISGTFGVNLWRGGASNQTIKLVVGLRDSTGAWVGGEPQVVQTITDAPQAQPGKVYNNITFTNITAPPGVLSYVFLWLAVGITDDAQAIQQFKNAVPPLPVGPQYAPAEHLATMETNLDKVLGICVGESPGLVVAQANPSTWTLQWATNAPPLISGAVSIVMQAPTGDWSGSNYMVTVGIRDGLGNWVGGKPQVIASDRPPWDLPHAFPQRGFAGLSAPTNLAGGPYTVWAQMFKTGAVKTAIAQFKLPIAPAENEFNRIVGTIVIPTPAVAIGSATPNTWLAPPVRRQLNGMMTLTMWNGGKMNAVLRVVCGIRNAAGAWVGSQPQVILIDTPPAGSPGKTYTDRHFYNLVPPAAAGIYTIWIRMTQLGSDKAALADFRAAVPAAEDDFNRIVGIITVPP